MNYEENGKKKIIYLGFSIIFIIFIVLALALEYSNLNDSTIFIFKIVWILSFLLSFFLFRTYIYPYFSKKIDKHFKDRKTK